MPRNAPTSKLVSFTGLRTADIAQEVGLRGFVTADNIDISRTQRVSRRAGFSRVYTGNVDAAWGDEDVFLFTDGADLHSLNADYTSTILRSDLTSTSTLAAYRHGRRVYYSNGINTGVVENGVSRSLGLALPGAPVLSTSGGALPAGTYLAAVTYVRDDGQESGTSDIASITVTAGSDITLGSLSVSTDTTVVSKNLYLSRPDGSELFLAMNVANAATSATYSGGVERLQRVCRTKFLTAPLPFTSIDFMNGRLVYAQDEFVYYTEPFSFELFDVRYNFIPMGERVNTVAIVDAGLFIGTDTAHYFGRGDDITKLVWSDVASYGAVPGRVVYGDAEQFDSDFAVGKKAAVWVTKRGIAVGTSGGEFVNVTEKRAAFTSDVQKSAAFIRRLNGQNHYVSVVQS